VIFVCSDIDSHIRSRANYKNQMYYFEKILNYLSIKRDQKKNLTTDINAVPISQLFEALHYYYDIPLSCSPRFLNRILQLRKQVLSIVSVLIASEEHYANTCHAALEAYIFGQSLVSKQHYLKDVLTWWMETIQQLGGKILVDDIERKCKTWLILLNNSKDTERAALSLFVL